MYKITICIPTFRRIEMLRKLILSIMNCNVNKTLIKEINLFIVDNDPEKSAEAAVSKLAERPGKLNRISYHCFPVKGLANVRNELLRVALQDDPDYIVFIDDDEYVIAEWLDELAGTITVNKGDMVMGPVISGFDEKVPQYITRWIERPSHENNSRMNFIRTGNLIIRTKTLTEYNIRFDQRFNMTGGEDSYFGVKMIGKGATVYWAANAIAYETVPGGRANIQWLFRRYYNGANVYTRILGIEGLYRKLFKKVLVSLFYLIVGGITSVMALLPLATRYWGVLKFAEGSGGIAGLFSIEYKEYE
jgi:succinoglycan biosynthesis protein ExoM